MRKEIWLEEFKKVDWDWDFKNCYSSTNKDHGICLFLKYKLGLLMDNSHPLKYTKIYGNKYIGRTGDCDKEVYPVYNHFTWQKTFEDSIRGETMNSFTITFHRAILLSENKEEMYKEMGINKNQNLNKQYEILLKDKNYQKFSIIEKNLEEFERFAQLTHSIGNFTVLPYWMNTGRGASFAVLDYWDITLNHLYEFLQPLGGWEKFVSDYYLQPFVDSYLVPVELWKNHIGKAKVKITSEAQIEQFLINANKSIEERGKFIKRKLNNEIDETAIPKFADRLGYLKY